jgi:hypothetical protein
MAGVHVQLFENADLLAINEVSTKAVSPCAPAAVLPTACAAQPTICLSLDGGQFREQKRERVLAFPECASDTHSCI